MADKNYDHKEFGKWLRGHPPEVGVALASLTALRVLPIVGRSVSVTEETADIVFLPVLRASTLAWWFVDDRNHARVNRATAAAFAAARAADAVAADAVAADAVAAANSAAASAAVATRADAAAVAAVAAISVAAAISAAAVATYAYAAALHVDREAIAAGVSALELARRPLWPENMPEGLQQGWKLLREDLLARDPNWSVWTDWYDDRLAGRPADLEFEIARVNLPEKLWKKGAKAVNAELVRIRQGLLEKRRREAEPEIVEDTRTQSDQLAQDVFETIENLEDQAPAAFRFGWEAESVVASAPVDVSTDPQGAQIYLDEARRKAQLLLERLERANSDQRVVVSVSGLLDVLTERIEDLRPQLVRSRARSIEADAQAYASQKDEERELFPDAVAALIDLSETVRDLQGCYPQLRDLEAEITALGMEPAKVADVKAQLDSIVDEAVRQESFIDQTAVDALTKVKEIAAEDAPAAVKQKRIAEYALVVRNFISPVARFVLDNAFVREAKQLGSDIYAKARPKVVDGIGDGLGSMARPATIIGIAAFVGFIAGPVAGVATAAAGFGKIDRLMQIAERWMKERFKGGAEDRGQDNDEDGGLDEQSS